MTSFDNFSNMRVPSNSGNNYQADNDGKKITPPEPKKPFREVLDRRYREQSENKKLKKRQTAAETEIEIDNVADDDEEEKPKLLSIYATQHSEDKKSDDSDLFDQKEKKEAELVGKADPSAKPLDISDTDEESKTATLKASKQPIEKPVAKHAVEKSPNLSPFAMYKQLSKPDQKSEFGMEGIKDFHGPETKTVKQKSEKGDTKFQQEQQETAMLNPFANTINAAQDVQKAQEAKAPVLAPQLQEIVDRIVKEMYTIEQSGKTDTIIILNQIKGFENARVVVTSFDYANKEYNLSFENLTMRSKQIIDQNLYSLRAALEDKGYARAIHIVTTTTIVEHTIPGETSARSSRENRQGRQQQEKQQKEENTG